MLQTIVRHSLLHPWLVVLIVAILGGAGMISLRRANYDVFPNFAPPIITVETIVPGLAAADVETQVTTPVENAINGVPGLAKLRSQSVAGLSAVTAVFHGGTDLYRDRELVAQRVADAASQMPAGARPQLLPSQSATGTVLDIGLTSQRLNLIQLTELTRAVIRPALLAVHGVANVVVFGAQPQEWQVHADPNTLLAAHIGINQVIKAAAGASSIKRAGVLDTPNQRFIMQSKGQARTLEQLGDTVVDPKATPPLTLGAVAHLTVGAPPPIGAALIGQKRGLLLIVSAQYGTNTLNVAAGLRRALEQLAPGLAKAGVEVDSHALQPSTFIVEALNDLRNSLLIGAALILLVIVAALRNWRVALISFAVIPAALLITILVLNSFGFTLDTFSLGGLAIAIGIIVDDAIIDIENIRRRLHENQAHGGLTPRLRVILDSSLEVRIPIVFATLAIVAVFLPVFAIGDIAGRLFVPLAIAVIVAIIASLLLALTLTPALAALLLRSGAITADEPLFIDGARRLHRKALTVTRRRGTVLLAVVAALAVAAFVSLAFLPTRFLPRFHENDVIAHFLAPPGTSLPVMLRLGKKSVAILLKMPEVAHVVAHIGHANRGNGNADINKAELDITLSARGNRNSAQSEQAILAALRGAPGVHFWANTFLTERIHEVLSGTTAPIVLHVFGRHLRDIDADADHIAAALRGLPGAQAVTISAPPTTPSISIRLRRKALAAYGFQPQTVLEAIEAESVGREVGRVYGGGTSWPITVMLPQEQRADAAAVGALPLINGAGKLVPLSSLATIKEFDGRSLILHENAQRVQNVTVQVSGSASAFLPEARSALAKVALAPGDYVTFGGTAVASATARRVLLLASIGALATVLALVSLALGGAKSAALLAVNLPFALLGGIAALWIAQLPLSLGAAVGLVTVFGITLRNGLMLLAHYRHLLRNEGCIWARETADRGAVDRVVPVLLTALVTALGLLPLAFGAGLPGQEIEGPMAIVILGGLVTSTPLTLLALPGLAARFLHPVDFGEKPEKKI